ncbi:MAG: RNase A-like domain-containing protein [Pseudomonadota bacterium]
MTPVQLAAVLSGATLEEPSFSNRAWGVANALFGALETLGGGALLAVPEPTMLTKVGGGALGLHGIDMMQSGARQAWTGLETDTLTSDTTTAIAEQLGVDAETAERIGDGVDLAVPIVVSAGLAAVRIAAVRGGRISLAAHEAASGSRLGGHTISRHIGQTEAQLRARLAQQTRIPAASTFRTVAEAERIIGTALRTNKSVIANWANSAANGSKKVLEVSAQNAGFGVVRATGRVTQMNRVRIVLKKETFNGKLYYILTSFPVP